MTQTRENRVLDEKKQIEICALVSVGCSRRTAARLVGCSSAAIYSLTRRDESFRQRLCRAETQAELVPLRNIINASQTRWRAGAWLLERISPTSWGRRSPDALNEEHLSDMVSKLVGIIGEEVQDEDVRTRVYTRLVEVTKEWENTNPAAESAEDGRARVLRDQSREESDCNAAGQA